MENLKTVFVVFNRTFALLMLAVGAGVAGALDAAIVDQKSHVQQQFAPLFSRVNQELAENKQSYLADPAAYYRFISGQLKPSWDTASTTSALIGREAFDGLTEQQRRELVEAVDQTMQRYAFEGLEHYSGQVFHLVDVVVNEEKGMGWVQLQMESPYIPDFFLDLLIKQGDDGSWRAVDVRFLGITYVTLKKWEFRSLLQKQGVTGLIAALRAKNDSYFVELCKKATVTGSTPC